MNYWIFFEGDFEKHFTLISSITQKFAPKMMLKQEDKFYSCFESFLPYQDFLKRQENLDKNFLKSFFNYIGFYWRNDIFENKKVQTIFCYSYNIAGFNLKLNKHAKSLEQHPWWKPIYQRALFNIKWVFFNIDKLSVSVRILLKIFESELLTIFIK